MEAKQEFVQMINHPNYQIMRDFPHTIRRIDNKNIVSENIAGKGYVQVKLSDSDRTRNCYKHRLIAEQFIPNPDNLPQVDHINHDKKDNRKDNLRWCSASSNNLNRASNRGIQYEFVDDIPEDAIIVDFYNTRTERREFENERYYYYYNEESKKDLFYSRIDDNIYKILHINTSRTGVRFVRLQDTNNTFVSVVINRFKHQYDLL